MKVYFSERAENKLLKLSDYLIEKWGVRARDKFVLKLLNKIKQISTKPYSCPRSDKFEGIFKCVITKQTTLFYRILSQKNEIEVITLFDTRQNPELLDEEFGAP